MFRRRSYRPRKFSRRPRRAIRRRPKVSKKIKSYVKRAIHSNIENKEVLVYAANQTLTTNQSGLLNGSTAVQLLPSLAQGTGDNNRVGNCVRVVRGSIKGHVNLKPADGITNPLSTPCNVKMWLIRDIAEAHQLPLNGGVFTTYLDQFFRGNGTTLPFQGNLLDMSLPVDDQHFRVLKTKQFEIGATYASATGAVGTGGYFDNSKMIIPFYFNWAKYAKKQIKYSETNPVSTTQPINDNLYLIVQVVRSDGTASAGLQMAEWHYVNECKFEDA